MTVGEYVYKIEMEQITKLVMDLVNIESPYFKEDEVMKFVFERRF